MARRKAMILCDTNILIEFYKNNPATINELRQIGVGRLAISIITQAELYYGAIDKLVNNVNLYTLNTKDFRFIEGINSHIHTP
jgi:hypothetical protein